LITTLSVTAILTYVTVSLVLLMETMGFNREQYSKMVSMAVSFLTPFARNMLIGILIGCSMLCILLLMVLQPFTQIWHKRNSHNPKILWLRETIKAL
jgi:MFS superfamily sulfate permease-like transporter